jgi:hypothetical protein
MQIRSRDYVNPSPLALDCQIASPTPHLGIDSQIFPQPRNCATVSCLCPFDQGIQLGKSFLPLFLVGIGRLVVASLFLGFVLISLVSVSDDRRLFNVFGDRFLLSVLGDWLLINVLL